MTTRFRVYIATSLDGFIARPDGRLDWLPPPAASGEGYGYAEFMRTIDTIVMGRGTYETVLGFGEWPYGDTRVVVLSSGRARIPEHLAARVEASSLAPRALAAQLQQAGARGVYVDGGKTIQSFLRAGLIDDLTITTIPILIGAGLPLFGPLETDVRLELVSSRAFPSGFVQSRYHVARAP